MLFFKAPDGLGPALVLTAPETLERRFSPLPHALRKPRSLFAASNRPATARNPSESRAKTRTRASKSGLDIRPDGFDLSRRVRQTPFHEVADRHHTDQPAAVYDWQMADSPVRHAGHG